MSKTFRILLLPGDGIGPEVVGATARVLQHLEARGLAHFQIEEAPLGGASIDKYGMPLTDDTLRLAKKVDAILMGAVGGPKWDAVPYHIRPEQALLSLRKELDLFANLRPAMTFAPLISASSLKPEIVSGLDIMFIRELTGGMYFGEPRGITELEDGSKRGINTHVYTSYEIRRVARVAFALARRRRNKVCSVDKANVMEAGKLWRQEVHTVHQMDYGDVELSNMYADNCAMQLVRAPKQFDVILTDNLFGDLLSDEAAMLTGSLGMLPSASLGDDESGTHHALYEPIHGSAPDIAGQNIANPLATILSAAMMLRHTCHMDDVGRMLEQAVIKTLEQGHRTRDIATPGDTVVNTNEMADAVIRALD